SRRSFSGNQMRYGRSTREGASRFVSGRTGKKPSSASSLTCLFQLGLLAVGVQGKKVGLEHGRVATVTLTFSPLDLWIRGLEPRIAEKKGWCRWDYSSNLSETSYNPDNSPGLRILHLRINYDSLNWCGLKAYCTA